VGITYATVCMRCKVDAPEVGDFGYIGLPSLETKRTPKHTQPFGYLYAGLAALGLLTEEIEAFHAFLREHRGHPVHQFSDADADDSEDEGDEHDDLAPAATKTGKFVFKKGKFVEAFHVLACETCHEVQRGSESTRLRPLAARTLTAAEAKLFQTNCGDLEANTYRAGGFPFEDAEAIARFLTRHARHAVVVRLDEGENSAQPRSLRGAAVAPPAWTPPQWAPQLHESALGRTRDDKARAALVRLRHRDPAVRSDALVTLREVADPATFGHVAMMWRDPEPGVRAVAASALGAVDDPRKARVLGHALLDESEAVRAAAEAALRASKIDPGQAVALAARPRAPDTRPELKKHPDDLKTLLGALLDPNNALRGKAINQLAKHDESQATDALLESLADPSTSNRASAAAALVRHGKRDARVVQALVAALSDYGDGVVEAAVRALGTLKAREAVPLIKERLLRSRWAYAACLDALYDIGSAEAIDALASGLGHPARPVRGHALLKLSQRRNSKAIAHMVTALDDPAQEIRSQAAYALGKVKSNEAVSALVRNYRRPSELDRRPAVEALGKIGGPDALRVLVAALRDRSEWVREAAVTCLLKLKDERGRRALVSAGKRHPTTAAQLPKSLLAKAGRGGRK
jgi:HEAT repeat protein